MANDDEQKNEYLREHLPYELKMLHYTSKQMLEWQHYLSWNAHYEAFAVHARNLVKFLSNGDDGNFKADQFIRGGFKARTDHICSLMRKLDKQVFHSAKNRPSTLVGKFSADDAPPVCEWIEKNFADFLGKLSPEQRQMFDDKKADPSADEATPQPARGPTAPAAPQSACSSVGVQTYTTSFDRSVWVVSQNAGLPR
jgi:hypothetical protein